MSSKTEGTVDWIPAPLSVAEQLDLVQHRPEAAADLVSRGMLYVNESGVFCARVNGVVCLPHDVRREDDDEWIVIG